MASYDDLDALVGELKRASIDAYMVENGFEIDEAMNAYSSPGAGTSPVPSCTGRPSPDGSGGGQPVSRTVTGSWGTTTDSGRDYTAAFDGIRGDIDAIVEPWRGLPNPETIESVLASHMEVMGYLGEGVAEVGGRICPGGAIGNSVELVRGGIHYMTGEAAARFKLTFSGQIGDVAIGQFAIASLCAGHMAAQKGLWESARQDVANILDGARALMETLARKSARDWEVVFTVVGWVVRGLSLVPGAGTIAGVGSLGLSIVEEVVKEEGEEKDSEIMTPGSFGEAVSALDGSLTSLNRRITVEEELVSSNLVANEGWIRSRPQGFDIVQVPLTSENYGSITIEKPNQVRDVYAIYLPEIAESLSAAATCALRCSPFSALSRDGRVGVGQNGPSHALSEMNWLLYELASHAAWEAETSATNLRLAIQALEHFDEQVSSDLNATAAALEEGRGSARDPWSEPAAGLPAGPVPTSPGAMRPV